MEIVIMSLSLIIDSSKGVCVYSLFIMNASGLMMVIALGVEIRLIRQIMPTNDHLFALKIDNHFHLR